MEVIVFRLGLVEGERGLSRKRRRHVPLRTCIACQQRRPKRELVRIVRTPEGNLEVDPKGKRSGRGAYLCSDRMCWELGLDGKKLGRALKCQVGAGDLAELIEFAGSLPLVENEVGSEVTATSRNVRSQA